MTFSSSLLSRRTIIMLVVIVLVLLVSGLWYAGDKSLKMRQAEEVATDSKILAEYNQLELLVKQKQAKGEKFAHFTSELLGPSYTVNDLSIIEKETALEIRNYGLALHQALLPISIAFPDPTQLVLEAFGKQNSEGGNQISFQAKSYQQVTENLTKISVPQSAITAHLRLINNTRELSAILKAMSEITVEPIKALEASKILQPRQEEFSKALYFLNTYFKDKGIIFSEKEQILLPTIFEE